jgi:hypothetical protein
LRRKLETELHALCDKYDLDVVADDDLLLQKLTDYHDRLVSVIDNVITEKFGLVWLFNGTSAQKRPLVPRVR